MPPPEPGGLAGLVRPLPGAGLTSGRHALRDGLDLILAPLSDNAAPACGIEPPRDCSRSAAGGVHATVIAPDGRVGVDIETLARVALNASVDDAWLAPSERAAVRRARAPVLELACHWVLQEAYGKALGVGLALPLADLAFGGVGGAIALTGRASPAPARWRFSLYRATLDHGGDLLIAVAHGRPHHATPFAPLGRNPPAAPCDR